MAKIYGQIEKAQLEILAADPASPPLAYVYFNSVTLQQKIFNGTLWLSNSADISLGAIGAAPNATGATLTAQVLNLEPASAAFGGVMTTGTQTLAGDKTFTGQFSSLTTIAAGTFGFIITGGAGAARDIFLVGQAGFSNGFQVSYTGVEMKYLFADGKVGIGMTPVKTLDVAGTIGATGVITGLNLSGTNTGNVSVTTIGASPNANGLTLTGQVLNLEPASAAFGGVITTGVQTFSGAKTFTGAITASNLSGTNSGDTSLTAIGASPNANGSTLTGQVLNLEPASAAFGGVVTTGVQTFAGAKTFSGAITASNLTGTNSGDVSLTAVGAAPSANGATLSGQALTLQPADTTHPGVLTAADWNTFNGKQAAGSYITALTGEVTAAGPGSSAATVSNAAVIAKVLTGFVSGSGTVAAADSILSAVNKLDGNTALKSNTASPTFTGTVTLPTLVGTDTTDSTTSTTGAFKTAGGLGVAKAINAGTTITAVGAVTGSNLSGTNTGNVTLSAIGASPNANAATLTSQVLNLEPASASFGGVVTTGTQTLAGAKTWSGAATFSSTLAATSGLSTFSNTNVNTAGNNSGQLAVGITSGTAGTLFRASINATNNGFYVDNNTSNQMTYNMQAPDGSLAFSTDITGNVSLSKDLKVTGQISTQTAGKGLSIKEGSNAKMGTATLVAGSSVVSTTAVTATSRIFITSQVDGGTPGFIRVSTRTAGTSFTITGVATDTSTVAWMIVEPS